MSAVSADVLKELAELGSATVYEGGGRGLFVDLDLHQIVPGSKVAGPARTVLCGQDDNLMIHAAMAELQPGEVLVITMPEPRPIGVLGDLLNTQAQKHGAAALLIDAGVRDVEELRSMGLPIWARWIRIKGATKDVAGELGVPVTVGGARIRQGDVVVLDEDGVAVIEIERLDAVLDGARARLDKEAVKRAKLQAGELSFEIDGLREQLAELRAKG